MILRGPHHLSKYLTNLGTRQENQLVQRKIKAKQPQEAISRKAGGVLGRNERKGN
jgi:hypothetical protein